MQFEAVACRLFLHYSYTLAQKASNYGIFCFYYKNGSVWRIPVGVDLFGKGNSAFAEQFMQEVRGRVPKGVA